MKTFDKPDVSLRRRYSVNETAQILGIKRTMIYEYMKRGALRYRVSRMTSRRVISGMEIMRFRYCTEDDFLCYVSDLNPCLMRIFPDYFERRKNAR